MNLYILDTDHVSLAQREHPAVIRRLATRPARDIAVTIVTAEEQLRGWLRVVRRASVDRRRLVWAYSGLSDTLAYLESVQLLDFDQAALLRYETLRQQKIRIGTQDLRIAAIALAIDGTVVTRNTRDFAQVPGLALQDWTTDSQ